MKSTDKKGRTQMDRHVQEAFLKLVRLEIGPRTVNGSLTALGATDWAQLKALADAQGLTAVVLDGLNSVSGEGVKSMPKKLRLEWIGEVLQMEARCDAQRKAATFLGDLFHDNYIITYVLKGAVIAECYPHPNHRLSADLDCFLLPADGDFDAWSLGNSLVRSQGGKVDEDFYKNSTFYVSGLMVENHQYLTPFRGNKKMRELEVLLQGLLKEDAAKGVKDDARFEGTWLYRPPVMVSALFMIEHAYSHFLHEGLTWRMVLDWQLFSKKHHEEIDWAELVSRIDAFGFRYFYDSYVKLGQYLMGEISEADLSEKDKMLLDDIWNPLDLHEDVRGFKGKLALAGNTWRARWKYRNFTDINWLHALWIQAKGVLFEKHPTLN